MSLSCSREVIEILHIKLKSTRDPVGVGNILLCQTNSEKKTKKIKKKKEYRHHRGGRGRWGDLLNHPGFTTVITKMNNSI